MQCFYFSYCGALQWLWGNSATQRWLTASCCQSVAAERRCDTNAKERCFILTGIRSQLLAMLSQQQQQLDKEKGSTRKEAHQMKHVINGVWRALAVLGPLQDGHSQVQVDGSSARAKESPGFTKSQVYTVPLQHISQPFCLPSVFKKKEKVLWCLWWRMSEAAQPPPLRPPVLTVFQLPFFSPSESAVVLSLIFCRFLSLPPFLASLQAGWTQAHSVSVKICPTLAAL